MTKRLVGWSGTGQTKPNQTSYLLLYHLLFLAWFYSLNFLFIIHCIFLFSFISNFFFCFLSKFLKMWSQRCIFYLPKHWMIFIFLLMSLIFTVRCSYWKEVWSSWGLFVKFLGENKVASADLFTSLSVQVSPLLSLPYSLSCLHLHDPSQALYPRKTCTSTLISSFPCAWKEFQNFSKMKQALGLN